MPLSGLGNLHDKQMSKGKEGDGAESFEAGLFLNEEYALLNLDRPSAIFLLLDGNVTPSTVT